MEYSYMDFNNNNNNNNNMYGANMTTDNISYESIIENLDNSLNMS